VWAGTSRRCRGHSIFRAATIRTVGNPTTPHGNGWRGAFLQSLDIGGKRPGRRSSANGKACVGFSPIQASGNDDDYDVSADGAVVGRIMKANAAPVDEPWLWTVAFGHHEDRTPTHGYAATREATMAAFAKSWRRE